MVSLENRWSVVANSEAQGEGKAASSTETSTPEWVVTSPQYNGITLPINPHLLYTLAPQEDRQL